MKITLIQCPANNPDSPPYSLALLNACLKKAGHQPEIIDLNIALYNRAKKMGLENVWSQGHSQEAPIEKWIEEKFTSDKLKPHAEYINELVTRLITSDCNIIGFTVHTSSFWSSIQIAQKIKNGAPHKTIVFGGAYCFLNHEGVKLLGNYPCIDIVCFLEAEKSFPELLSKIEQRIDYYDTDGYGFRKNDGTIVNNYINTPHGKSVKKETFITNLDTVPWADWSCFNFNDYEEKYLPIITGRGCIRRCSFCNEAPVWGNYRFRSAQNIFDEIVYQSKLYPHVEVFWFMDSLVNGNIPMLTQLCDLLIAHGTAGKDGKERGNGKFGWTGQFLIRPEMTEELWQKISLSGGQWFACGLENGSDNVLKLMRKGYTREQIKTVMTAAHRVDKELVSVAMMVIGHPGEAEEDFQDTLSMIQFLKSLGISSSVSICDVRRDSPLWFMKERFGIVTTPDEKFPEGNPHTWYTKDGTNTLKHRHKLLQRTLDMKATMLHTLKVGEKGLEEGGINLYNGEANLESVAAAFLKKKNPIRLMKKFFSPKNSH